MGISVLMSVYYREDPECFKVALKSIINQTLKPDEIVIVKDGPLTDSLEAVIEEIKIEYPHIITYQFKENVQLGRALAKGLEICKNELIARMDTDDIACPNRFEIQYEYMMKHPEVAVCGGWIEEFDDEGRYRKIKKVPIDRKDILNYLKYRNSVNHVTVMFRKNEILQAGNYRHFPYMEDYYLWCRVVVNGGIIVNLPEVFVQVRVNEGVYNRRGGLKYFMHHYSFRREQRKLGLLNVSEFVIALLLSLGITLMPSSLRKVVYQKMLRR